VIWLILVILGGLEFYRRPSCTISVHKAQRQ
jgi:hypothetical protein